MKQQKELPIIFDYKEFYDEAPVGYITSNSSGIILNANKYFLALVQRDADEVIGKMCFWDFLPIGGKIYFQTHYFPTLQMEGKVKEINFELIKKNKTKVPVLINTTKSDKSNDSPVYNSVVFSISHRRLFEKEIIEDKKNAQELTRQLKEMNDRILIQSEIITKQNKSLDQLNSIKDKFFSIVAHDLKDPLNQLKSFVTLITDHIEMVTTEELQLMGQEVKHSLSNTIDLMNNLFKWAQSQVKDYGVKTSTFSIEEAVTEVIQNNLPIALEKGIALTYLVDGAPKVEADKNQLHFILRNLIINAIKFTPSGGFVKVHCHQTEKNQIKIAITDNGVGMSEELRSTIFENNVKISEVGTSGEKGHGFGLILVKEFISMNNGTIEVFGKEGEGTTFVVTLRAI